MSDRWQDLAACKGNKTIDWFPTGKGSTSTIGGQRNIAAARALCASCSVSDDCLRAAMENPDTVGIWAGTTLRQRNALRDPRELAPINHGTQGGYQTHRRRGEEPCQACKDGNARAKLLYRASRRAS